MSKVLRYMIGVPIVAAIHFTVYLALFGTIFAIGESGSGGVAVVIFLAIPFAIMSFPGMFLGAWTPLGDMAKGPLGDNGAIYLFAAINAIIWGFFLVWLFGVLKRRYSRQGNSEQTTDSTPSN